MPKSYFRFRPIHYEVVRRAFTLMPHDEIAASLGLAYNTVCSILNSVEGREVMDRLQNRTLDLTAEQHVVIQAAIPQIVERKIETALNAPDWKLRDKAQTDLMAVAGLTPQTRVVVQTEDPATAPYRGLSEAELRRKLLDELTANEGPPPPSTPPVTPEPPDTVH